VRSMQKTFLNIGDTAGVASLLSKYLSAFYSIESQVVGYRHLDTMGITAFYGGKLLPRSRLTNARLLLIASRFPAVHLHVHVDLALRLRSIYPGKKLIVHWHGEELRLRGWRGVSSITRAADATFVSTQDLLHGAPEGVVYLPNPVDTEHFRPMPSLRRQNSALYLVKRQRNEDTEWARRLASRLGLELEVRDRVADPVDYGRMPELLNRYEYYIDRNYIQSLSKTALEALSCGVKVIDWKEDVVTALPEDHRPKNVVERFVSALRARSFDSILQVDQGI